MTLPTKRVLVAEGDADVRDMIEDLLFDHGFEVHLAANADEATLALRGDRFDILLCHLPMLREEGDRLSHRVHELQPSCRVVAMSAGGAQASGDEASANLPKPFARSQLLAAFQAL